MSDWIPDEKIHTIGGLAAGNRRMQDEYSLQAIKGLSIFCPEPLTVKVPNTTPREFVSPRPLTTQYYQHTFTYTEPSHNGIDELQRPLSVVGEKLDAFSNVSLQLCKTPLTHRRQYYISDSSNSCSECSECSSTISPKSPPPSPVKVASDLKLDGLKMPCPDKRSKSELRDFKPGFIKKSSYCCEKCEGRMISHDSLMLESGCPFFSYFRHYSAVYPGPHTYNTVSKLYKERSYIDEELMDWYHKGDDISLPNLPYNTTDRFVSEAVVERFKEKQTIKTHTVNNNKRSIGREPSGDKGEEIILSTCPSLKHLPCKEEIKEEEMVSLDEDDNGIESAQTRLSCNESPTVHENNIKEVLKTSESTWANCWQSEGSPKITISSPENPLTIISQSDRLQQINHNTEKQPERNDFVKSPDSDENLFNEKQSLHPNISVSFQNLSSMSGFKENKSCDDVKVEEHFAQEAAQHNTTKPQYSKTEFLKRNNGLEATNMLQDIIRECAQGLKEISHRGLFPDVVSKKNYFYQPNTDKRYNRWKRRRRKKSKDKHAIRQFDDSSPDDSSAEENSNDDDVPVRPESLPPFRRRRGETIAKQFGTKQATICYDASSELTSPDRDNYTSMANYTYNDGRASLSDEDLEALVKTGVPHVQNGLPLLVTNTERSQRTNSDFNSKVSGEGTTAIRVAQNGSLGVTDNEKNDHHKLNTAETMHIKSYHYDSGVYSVSDSLNTVGCLVRHDSNSETDYVGCTIKDTTMHISNSSKMNPVKDGCYLNIASIKKNHSAPGRRTIKHLPNKSAHNFSLDKVPHKENVTNLDIDSERNYKGASLEKFSEDLDEVKTDNPVTPINHQELESNTTYSQMEESLLKLAKLHLQKNPSLSNKKYSENQMRSKLSNIEDAIILGSQGGNGKDSTNYRNVLDRFVQPLNVQNNKRTENPYLTDTALTRTLPKKNNEMIVVRYNKSIREKQAKANKQSQSLSRKLTDSPNKIMQQSEMANSDLPSLTLNQLLQTMPENKSNINAKTKKKITHQQECPILDVKKLSELAHSFITAETDINTREYIDVLKEPTLLSKQEQLYNERSLSSLSFSRAFTFSVFDLPIAYKEKNKQIGRKTSIAVNSR